jgi:hypothetical protein
MRFRSALNISRSTRKTALKSSWGFEAGKKVSSMRRLWNSSAGDSVAPSIQLMEMLDENTEVIK